MDKLTALPISGESFLLRRQGRHILVDGGHGSRALCAALLSRALAVDHLDIVVCTHADRDHAGGLVNLLNLLDKSSIKVGEFWLPGAWAESLPELLHRPASVIDGLVSELDAFPSDALAGINLANKEAIEAVIDKRVCAERHQWCNDQAPPEKPQETRRNGTPGGLGWLKDQLLENTELEQNEAVATRAFNKGRRQVRARASRPSVDYRLVLIWLDLINTAERIRKIAMQAIRYNVRVRWFDFGEFSRTGTAKGGERGLLEPLNSVELRAPPPLVAAWSYLSRLTPVNEECLVFLSPPVDGWPDGLGVVFTGDSPLGEGRGYGTTFLPADSRLHFPIVATAPHLGSENNMMAYAHLKKWAHVVLWLRAGGTPKHPGSTFRSLPSYLRACTQCSHRKLERRLADVQLSNGRVPWLLRVSSHDCCCT